MARDVDGVLVGEEWTKRLFAEIDRADAVVALLSAESLRSQWCSAELQRATAKEKTILPVRLERGVDSPLILENVQAADHETSPNTALQQVRLAVEEIDKRRGVRLAAAFPGLRPFTRELADHFHGRAADTDAAITQLRQLGQGSGGILAVVGPSGCGKSSFLQAGVLPRLEDEGGWEVLPVWTPGADPVSGLAETLGALTSGRPADDLRAGSLAAFVDELCARPEVAHRPVVLPVDQAEELLGPYGGAGLRMLGKLLALAPRIRLHVVLTLRSEFQNDLARAVTGPGLRLAVFPLTPLGPAGLREAIEGSAQRLGVPVEPALTNQLVAETLTETGSEDALPLLAFTLRELADPDAHDRFTLDRYKKLGGVRQALTRHANATLDAVAHRGTAREEALRRLRSLVTADDEGRPVRQRLRVAELDPTLQAFLDARLLVSDVDERGRWITVVHEALFTHWQPLRTRVDTAALLLAGRLHRAAREWKDADWAEPDQHLWGGRRLAAAETLDPDVLQPAAAEFLAASRSYTDRQGRRARRRRALTAAGLAVLLILTAAVAGQQLLLHRATESATKQLLRVATARELQLQASAVRGSEPARALRLAVASQRLDPTRGAENLLLNMLNDGGLVAELTGHEGALRAVAYRPDGRVLATGGDERSVRLWDTDDRERPRQVGRVDNVDNAAVTRLAFAPGSRGLLAAAGSGVVRLWDTADPATPIPLGVLRGHTGPVLSVAFSADGATLASAGNDGTVRLWDVTDPRAPRPLGIPLGASDGGPVRDLVFTADDRTLVTAVSSGTIQVWDVADRERVRLRATGPAGHSGAATSVAVDPRRPEVVATGGNDGQAIFWEVGARPRRIGEPLLGRSGAIVQVAFLQRVENVYLLAAGTGDMVTDWNVTASDRPGPPRTTAGHAAGATGLAISPDAFTLATAGMDATARLVDLAGRRAADLVHPLGERRDALPAGATGRAAYGPDGHTLLTAGPDGAVRTWSGDAPPADPLTTTAPTPHAVQAAALAGGRRLLATGDDAGTLRLWDVTNPRRPVEQWSATLDGPITALALPTDGRLLVVGSWGRPAVVLWDLAEPAHPERIGLPVSLASFGIGPTAAALSPDGRTLAVAAGYGELFLWDVTDPAQPRQIPDVPAHQGSGAPVHRDRITALAFTPDGRTLATASVDHAFALWDVMAPEAVRLFGRPVPAGELGLTDVVFTADGRSLVTAASDGDVALWDVADRAHPERLMSVATGTAGATGLAVGPDGLLAATFADGRLTVIRLDDVEVARSRLVGLACARAGGGLDPQQWQLEVRRLDYETTCPAA